MVADGQSKNWKVPFFAIWSGQAVSLLGSQMVQFALVWWLTQETGSATVLATASLVAFLPSVFLGPIAGALVDRWSRRVTMILADSLMAGAILILALLFWSGRVEIWHIYAIMFMRALGGSFHWPAMQASTSLMVPQEHLSRVQGMNQVLQGAMSIGAAPLGALLLSLLPLYGILAIDVVTAGFAILPLFFIAIPQPKKTAAAEAQPKSSLFQDLRQGFQYVLRWPGLLMMLMMVTVINFLVTPAFTLMPILVTDHFQGEAYHLAATEAVSGVGMIIGGLALAAWGGFKKRILTTFTGLVFLGIFLVVVGLVPGNAFLLAVVMLFGVGLTIPIINGPMMAVTQSVVKPELQGRVFTLIQSGAVAMTPIGLMIAGPLSDHIGSQAWFFVGGVATLVMGAASFFIPALVNIEEDGRAQGEAEAPAGAVVVPSNGD